MFFISSQAEEKTSILSLAFIFSWLLISSFAQRMNEKREKNVKEQKKSHIEQNEQIELFTLLSFYGLDDMQRMYRVKERSKKADTAIAKERRERARNINEAAVKWDPNVIAHTDNEAFSRWKIQFSFILTNDNSAFGTVVSISDGVQHLHLSSLFYTTASAHTHTRTRKHSNQHYICFSYYIFLFLSLHLLCIFSQYCIDVSNWENAKW